MVLDRMVMEGKEIPRIEVIYGVIGSMQMFNSGSTRISWKLKIPLIT